MAELATTTEASQTSPQDHSWKTSGSPRLYLSYNTAKKAASTAQLKGGVIVSQLLPEWVYLVSFSQVCVLWYTN